MEPTHPGRSCQSSAVIRAHRHVVYRAFLERDLLAQWLPPDAMTGEVHAFEPGEGGGYRMTLTYQDPSGAPGKTTEDADTFTVRFAELIPTDKIVQFVKFESAKPGFEVEMKITVTVTDEADGTLVRICHEDLPTPVRPEDDEEGIRQSLRKLAALLER